MALDNPSQNEQTSNLEIKNPFENKRFTSFDGFKDKLNDLKNKNGDLINTSTKIGDSIQNTSNIKIASFDLKVFGKLDEELNQKIQDKKDDAANLVKTAQIFRGDYSNIFPDFKNNINTVNTLATTLVNPSPDKKDITTSQNFLELKDYIISADKFSRSINFKSLTKEVGNIYSQKATANTKETFYIPVNKDQSAGMRLYKAVLNNKTVYVSDQLTLQSEVGNKNPINRIVFDEKGEMMQREPLQNAIQESENFKKNGLSDVLTKIKSTKDIGLLREQMKELDRALKYSNEGAKISAYLKKEGQLAKDLGDARSKAETLLTNTTTINVSQRTAGVLDDSQLMLLREYTDRIQMVRDTLQKPTVKSVNTPTGSINNYNNKSRTAHQYIPNPANINPK